jgi:hypothetical protein
VPARLLFETPHLDVAVVAHAHVAERVSLPVVSPEHI